MYSCSVESRCGGRDCHLGSELRPRVPNKTSNSPSPICASSTASHLRVATAEDVNMPSKLAKVQKHVTKKKGANAASLHENSRDARRLRKAGARDDSVAKKGAVREKANKQWTDRVAFFQQNIPETLHPLERGEIQALIQEYLERSTAELEQLVSERRPGRPPSTRQTLLEQARQMEAKEYEGGFWLPNLQDEETLTKLDGWKGEWIALATMRFIRVQSDGKVKESAFPPRGSS